jgi:hypothetical protein
MNIVFCKGFELSQKKKNRIIEYIGLPGIVLKRLHCTSEQLG